MIVTAAIAGLTVGCSSSHPRSAQPSGTTASTEATTTIPTTTTTTGPITYEIKRGDTLATIATRFRVSITAIVALNHIANADRLTAGQQLKIPLAPPLKLTITPSTGPQGEQFKLTLTGAQPSETITFEIRSPKGVFRGPPHTASPDGTVTATYQPALAGKYSVIAHGSEGTAVPTTLVVLASTVTS